MSDPVLLPAKMKSPSQSVALRSPMEKHMGSASKSSRKEGQSGAGKITFASPSASTPSKSLGSTSKSTPPKAAADPKSSQKKSSSSVSTGKKRKAPVLSRAALESTESEIQAKIDKLRKDSKAVKARLARIEEEAFKFPIKDEMLLELDAKHKPSADLPAPVLALSSMLADDVVNDAIGVWDFLNTFGKSLAIHPVEWEDFIDLLKFTGRSSVALSDIFCALLKIILSDPASLNKLIAALPRKVSYSYRSKEGELLQDATGEVDFNVTDLLQQEDFDCEYNGLRLLPKLKPDAADVFKYQAVLRCIFLRLEPVRQLRRAVLDVTSVAHHSYHSEDPCVEHGDLTALVSLASAYKRRRTKTPAVRDSEGEDSPTAMEIAAPHTEHKELSASCMAAIATPKLTKASKNKGPGLDKDAIFQITGDVSQPLRLVYEAASMLESVELHQLKAKHKLAILKILCDACEDTQRIRTILDRNAEERHVQISNMNRTLREAKAKAKEASMAKKEAAFQACRKVNTAAADAEAARALTKPKKGKKAAPPPKVKGKEVVKGSAGGKDGLDPTADQLASMIEEMVLLEKLGIDVVEDVVEDSSDDEDEDTSEDEFEYDSRGNLLQKRPRRVTSTMRAKALDRKRSKVDKKQRQQQVEIATDRLDRALESKSERELKAAVKFAERFCRWSNEEGLSFCTTSLKKAYTELNEIDVQAKEDRATSQAEKAQQEYFVRTLPIGQDRHRSQYFSFVGDDRLFVQSREPLLPEDVTCLLPASSGPDVDPVLNRLFDSRPNRYRYKWSVFCSPNEQWLLWDALDERGERECALKAAIKARFDIEEPPVVYQTTGSEYIGRNVRRVFGKKNPVMGLIVGWLPATDEEPALWHVQHLDGDEEDMDEEEVRQYLIVEMEDSEDQVVQVDREQPWDVKEPSARLSGVTTIESSRLEETADDDEEAEFEEEGQEGQGQGALGAGVTEAGFSTPLETLYSTAILSATPVSTPASASTPSSASTSAPSSASTSAPSAPAMGLARELRVRTKSNYSGVGGAGAGAGAGSTPSSSASTPASASGGLPPSGHKDSQRRSSVSAVSDMLDTYLGDFVEINGECQSRRRRAASLRQKLRSEKGRSALLEGLLDSEEEESAERGEHGDLSSVDSGSPRVGDGGEGESEEVQVITEEEANRRAFWKDVDSDVDVDEGQDSVSSARPASAPSAPVPASAPSPSAPSAASAPLAAVIGADMGAGAGVGAGKGGASMPCTALA
mmetsp:Transcript_30144/g.68461  ORF Transcript_30144/g.68461 Transcript_30144/m.68461 type:complete len:1247 (-) Transcript_30144:1529-5269(-)